MALSKLHFQLSFSKSSLFVIHKLYNLAPEDEILMAVWFSDSDNSIFDRRGFVITKEGFGWNYIAMAESTQKDDAAKERVPRKSEFLNKKKVRFLGTDTRDTETAARDAGKREIQLRTSETLFTFAFDSGIPQEKVVLLERAIASNFADAFDANSYEKMDCSYSFPLTLLAIKDFFVNIKDVCQKKLCDLKLSLRKRKEEKLAARENSRNEADKSTVIKSVNKIGSFFRHIVDLCTDLILMFALLIFVKPQLLMKDFLNGVTASISGINISFFYYNWDLSVPQDILDKRNFIFIVLAGLFLILKIFISLSCRKNRKAVTALLFIMLVADFFLIHEKFIIFAVLLLLILLTMQFSMGFSARVVRVKTLFFLLFSIVFYLVIHILLYDEFAEQIIEVLNIMKLPVKWW